MHFGLGNYGRTTTACISTAHGGGILVHDGTFYWFGQHMVEGDAGNYAQVGVHAYSSKDLYHWKDEGIALRVSADPKSDITKGCILERPKVVYNRKTGRFVMWFHLELKGKGYGAARSGVAVAEQADRTVSVHRKFPPERRGLANQCPCRTEEASVGRGRVVYPQSASGRWARAQISQRTSSSAETLQAVRWPVT